MRHVHAVPGAGILERHLARVAFGPVRIAQIDELEDLVVQEGRAFSSA